MRFLRKGYTDFLYYKLCNVPLTDIVGGLDTADVVKLVVGNGFSRNLAYLL